MIAELVGASRKLSNYIRENWFTPDSPDSTDKDSYLWTKNAQIGKDYSVSDSVLRDLIKTKIFKNVSRGASIPEARMFLKFYCGDWVSFIKTGICRMQMVVKNGFDVNILRSILTKQKEEWLNNFYLFPSPPEFELEEKVLNVIVENNQFKTFAPDRIDGAPDYAYATISLNILEA